MKMPRIDLEELRKAKKENFRQRLGFIDMHVDFIKKKSNDEWSREQSKIINRK